MNLLKNFFSNVLGKLGIHHDDSKKFENLKFPLHGIYFFKNGCPHCQDFSKSLDEFMSETQIKEEILKFEKIDVQSENNDEEKLTIIQSLNGVPSVIFLDSNKERLEYIKIEGNDFEEFKKIYEILNKSFSKESS